MTGEKAWHEDDKCWEAMEPLLFGSSRLENTAAEVDRIIQLTGLQPGATVLDLCCGVGRHSLELARRGFSVTGVDRTEGYLARAAEQGGAEGLAVEFVREDMRRFCREKSFEAVFNLFTSFGYFEDQEDDYTVAANVCRSLKPGGLFLMDMMGKEVLARIFRERDWHRVDDDMVIMEERRLSKNWGWIDSRWTLLMGNERREITVSHRLYSAVELSMLLEKSGFQSVEVFGGYDGRPYDQAANRLVALARV